MTGQPRSRIRALGDNLAFLRALSKIQGLKGGFIGGYCGPAWVAYLEEKMSLVVEAKRGWEYVLEKRGLSGGKQKIISGYKCQNDKEQLPRCREFREGTGHLVLWNLSSTCLERSKGTKSIKSPGIF